MRVNVYAEELTGKVELVEKDGFTGVRFWLYLPVSLPGPRDSKGHGPTAQGPFIHKLTTFDHDDDSSAVTFWGKKELRASLVRAVELLDAHHAKANP